MKLRLIFSHLLLCLGLSVLVSASTCGDVRSIDDDIGTARGDALATPKWTPDGSKILLGTVEGTIYVVNSDGSNLRSISLSDDHGADTPYAVDFSPDLSPDGSGVVYSTYRHADWGAHNFELKAYALKGPGFRRLISTSRFKRLTRSRIRDTNPAWSPTGERIAFVSGIDYGSNVVTMAPDGSDSRMIVARSSLGGSRYVAGLPPVWSPDGRTLAVVVNEVGPKSTYHNVIYVVGADGTGLTRLAETLSQPAVRNMGDFGRQEIPANQPTWSPSGRRLAFVKFEDEAAGIYTISPDGSNLREILPDIGVRRLEQFWHPNLSWSPDGAEILVGSNSAALGNLVLMSDGTGVRELPGPGGYASWSPNSTRIAVSPQAHPVVALYTVNRDGSNGRVLVMRESGTGIPKAAYGAIRVE